MSPDHTDQEEGAGVGGLADDASPVPDDHGVHQVGSVTELAQGDQRPPPQHRPHRPWHKGQGHTQRSRSHREVKVTDMVSSLVIFTYVISSPRKKNVYFFLNIGLFN